ncbi:helix-turn-helix domain-containing protein [Actinacidiphila paucisporea]|uniref:helix-turn-helix domain-containing protein n=1 Tax=Actinacidiphila paucisporea TaxID=310782 RepID=UPI000936957D|nr:helix-turn-helix transcriptional regulator [Actinacidiphila paucisporea]
MTWARTKAGLTKRALAQQIGISEALMGEIESGWRSATPANLLKIAAALNCPVVFLERKRSPETPPPPAPGASSGQHHQDGDSATKRRRG